MAIFKGYVLQLPDGDTLTPREQDEAIRYVLERIEHYPQAARELRMFMNDELTAEELSPSTLRALRELGSEWLRRRKKERGD